MIVGLPVVIVVSLDFDIPDKVGNIFCMLRAGRNESKHFVLVG